MALEDSQYRHYHIHSPEESRFNPDIPAPRAVGIAEDHIVDDEAEQMTTDSDHYNPDIDSVDMTPQVKVPSFAEWFGNPNNFVTIRTALKAGGATGEQGVNYEYYKSIGALPTHPASQPNQQTIGEPGQLVTS